MAAGGRVRLTALAESDLLDIWQYGFERRDDEQADRYPDEPDKGIALLASNPQLGTGRDEVREGYRVLFVRQHAVYYIVTDAGIRIVRILHSQMDPERHL